MRSIIGNEVNEFNRLTKAFSDLYRSICVQSKMSASTFDILYSIAALGDGCCQKDICAYSFSSKQTIHSSIRKLEQEEILYMKPGKGREMQIFLTEKGRHYVDEKITPIIAMENQAFKQMAPEQRTSLLFLTETYLTYLRTLTKNLDGKD